MRVLGGGWVWSSPSRSGAVLMGHTRLFTYAGNVAQVGTRRVQRATNAVTAAIGRDDRTAIRASMATAFVIYFIIATASLAVVLPLSCLAPMRTNQSRLGVPSSWKAGTRENGRSSASHPAWCTSPVLV